DDWRTRRKDETHAGLLQLRSILWRDDAATSDHDVPGTFFAQPLDEFRHQSAVSGGLRGDANDVYIVVDGHARYLRRCLEQCSQVDVEAGIRESRRHDLSSAVVSILAQLR